MADKGDSPPKKKARPSMDLEDEEGFKFTKKSRRTRIGPKKSASKSAKKRRSSFVFGRKERKSLAPPVTVNIPSLHIHIPAELPPNARLRQLFDTSLELAITKLEEKSTSVKSDLPDFEEEAKAAFHELRQLISETDLVDNVCQPPEEIEVIPNPQNKTLEESAVTCKLVTQRLRKEDNKWNDLLQENKKLEEKAKMELEDYMESSGSKEELPDFLSPAQHKLLSGKPPFKTYAEQREKLQQETILMVDQIAQVVNGLQQYKKVTEDYLNRQTQAFGAKSLNAIKDMGTPRTLIRGHLKGQQA